jgi:hypothetical protein
LGLLLLVLLQKLLLGLLLMLVLVLLLLLELFKPFKGRHSMFFAFMSAFDLISNRLVSM